ASSCVNPCATPIRRRTSSGFCGDTVCRTWKPAAPIFALIAESPCAACCFCRKSRSENSYSCFFYVGRRRLLKGAAELDIAAQQSSIRGIILAQQTQAHRHSLGFYSADPSRHTLLEDTQGLATGALVAGLGFYFLNQVGLLTGGT